MKAGYRAKQALGQHFLNDPALLNRLVDASGVGPEDAVFEIGPGMGSLTRVLASRVKEVLALEVDPELLPLLRVTLHGHENARVLQGDVMTADLPALLDGMAPLHVVANLPYYITTPILNLLLTVPAPFQSINVMVQKEAAERVVAVPSTPAWGPLAVLCQYRATPRVAMGIPAGAFQPSPKTDSCFVVMPIRDTPPVDPGDEGLFFRLVKAAFAMRRKTLLNNLMPAFSLSRDQARQALAEAGLSPNIRGEALGLAELAALSRTLAVMTHL